MHSFSSFWQVHIILPCYLHSSYIFCIMYKLWRWHFGSYFLLAYPRTQNWRKNLQVLQKIFLKIYLCGVHGVCFFQVCVEGGCVECSAVYDSKLSCEVRLWGDRWWNLSSHSHPLKIRQYSSCKMIRIRNKSCR